MFVVYTDNEADKKYFEGEFPYQSGHFVVPSNHAKPLHDLIDRTCYEFYQKNESIFIQKLKMFISGLVDFSVSFSLWRQILSLLKQKDQIADMYRNHLITLNKFFLEDDKNATEFVNADGAFQKLQIQDQFEKVLISHKTLELGEVQNQPIASQTCFAQYEQFIKDKNPFPDIDDKLSTFQSQRTNDETIEQIYNKTYLDLYTSRKIEGNCISMFSATPIKAQKSGDDRLLTANTDKNKEKKSTSRLTKNQEDDDFINSFKKHRSNAITEMILQDESLGQIAKKQKKKQKQRKKLEDQLYEKTKSIKSNEYNKNIKNVLLNRKLKQRKKPTGFQGIKSQITNVVGAYELRRVSSEIIQFPQDNLKLFKSAGKPVK